MNRSLRIAPLAALGLALALAGPAALAKDVVKVGFIAPLTGGTSAVGLGGRNSADLAVRLRNQDPKAKYQYEMISPRRRVQTGHRRPGRDQARGR